MNPSGMRWCSADYAWPGLIATGWYLTGCHVHHAVFNDNNDPIGIAGAPRSPSAADSDQVSAVAADLVHVPLSGMPAR